MTRRTLLKALILAVIGAVLPVQWIMNRKRGIPSPRLTEGLGPGAPQVLQVRDAAATRWNYRQGDYIDFIDHDAVRRMLETGLVAFAGVKSSKDAWEKILQPFRPGDKIVLKPNLNNPAIGYSKAIMTSPQLIAAVAESLIAAGYPARDITVYDLTAVGHALAPLRKRWFQPLGIRTVFLHEKDTILEKIVARMHLRSESPDLNEPIRMSRPVPDVDRGNVQCYIPKVLSEAQHLINLPVLKAHQFVLQSSCLKNHFGTVRFSNLHSYPVVLHGEMINRHIADINANPHIRDKTRLCIADALFGAGCFTRGENGRLPRPWKTLNAGNTPNSLFISTDPVALESVLADRIMGEQKENGFEPYSHQYLHDAAELGLGVHEHQGDDGRYARIMLDVIDL